MTVAKRKKKESGEQLDLIDVGPKHSKEILAALILYDKHKKARMASGVKEVEQKTLILELVEKAGLQRLAGGVIKFVLDGIPVKITPRDQLVEIGVKKQAAEKPKA